MGYHTELIVAALVLMVITCVYHRMNYYDNTFVSKYFSAMGYCSIFMGIFDLISCVMINTSTAGKYEFLFRLVTALYFIDTLLVVLFLAFYVSARRNLRRVQRIHTSLWIVTIVYAVIYTALCLFTNKIFYVYGDMYFRGPWQFLSFIPTFIYLIRVITLIFKSWTDLDNRSWRVHIVLFILCCLGFASQFVFSEYMVLTFCIAIGLLIVLFTLETPDYKKLKAVLVELSESEANALRENENKNQFLRQLSHELRTPLNSVKGAVELMSDKNKKKEEVFEIAEAAINSLIYVADEMLDINKINKGYSYEEREIFSPVEVINRLRERYLFSILSRGHRLEIDLSPSLPKALSGEKKRMMAALQFFVDRLLDWDIDTICLKADGRYIGLVYDFTLSILISLNSPYKSEDFIKNYAKEMFGIDAEIENQNNRITVTSHFTCDVTDPAVVGTTDSLEENDNMQENIEDEPVSKPEIKVLYVDDNELNLRVFCGYMKKIGNIIVTTANSGKAAIDIINNAEENFDIMFLDYMMPEMDGIELFNWIKKESKMSDVPVSALTANAVSGEKERFLGLGFDEYISKPYTIDYLKEILEKYT